MKRRKCPDMETINKRLAVPKGIEIVLSLIVAPDTWVVVLRNRSKPRKDQKS